MRRARPGSQTVFLSTTLKVSLLALAVFWLGYEARWTIRAKRQVAAEAQARLLADAKAQAKAKALADAKAKAFEDFRALPPQDLARLALCLPKALYAFPGRELRIYFENIVTPTLIHQLSFKVRSAIGTQSRRYWSATFTADQVGRHPLEIVVCDLEGKELMRGKTEVRVAPERAGEGKALRLLIIGDSLTHATHYPNRLDELCSQSGNPQLEMIGTHKLDIARPGVVHEGYNGWTWWHFLTFHWPGEFYSGTPDKSPLIYLDSAGQKHLDVPRYLRETSPRGPPDLVILQLGINDVFCLPDQEDIFAPGSDFISPNVDKLTKAFRAAAPSAALGIWLTQPVNATQESFDFSYRNDWYSGIERSQIAMRQHGLVQKLIQRYGSREQEGIFLIPICATVDPLDDYDADNSVHPSRAGYRRIGESVYAWMKWWLANESWTASRSVAAKPGMKDSVPVAVARKIESDGGE